MGLRRDFYASALLAAGLAIAIAAGAFRTKFDHNASESARLELVEAVARVSSVPVDAQPLAHAIDQLAARARARVSVYDRQGHLLAESGSEHAVRSPLVGASLERLLKQARAEGLAERKLHGTFSAQPYVAAARAFTDGTSVVVCLVRAVDAYTWLRAPHALHFVLAALLTLLVAALVAEVVSRRARRQMGDVLRIARRLAAGDHQARVRSEAGGELGEVGRLLDRIGDDVEKRLGSVKRETTQLHALIDAMPDGVFVANADGTVVLSNMAFRDLSGGDPVGKTVVSALRNPMLHEAVQSALQGAPRAVTVADRDPGSDRTFYTIASPLPHHGGAVVVLHNISELLRLDRLRRDFVANASHELRTPLTAVRGFAETMRDAPPKDPDTVRAFAGKIAEHAIRLQHLISALLELSRAEAVEAALAATDVRLAEMAERVVSLLAQRAAAKQIRLSFEVDSEMLVRANEDALERILVNLVENAVKYTGDGGSVDVRATRTGARSVAIDVADTGPGIPRPHLDRIFEPFYRVDAGRARSDGGTGLGLAIVRELAKRIGAQISVESQVGVGSRFRLTLPQGTSRSSGEVVQAHDA